MFSLICRYLGSLYRLNNMTNSLIFSFSYLSICVCHIYENKITIINQKSYLSKVEGGKRREALLLF